LGDAGYRWVLFSLKKNFRRLSLSLASNGGVEVSVLKNGTENPLFTVSGASSAGGEPRTVSRRIRVIHADKARFRIRNAVGGESFCLFALSLEYTEGGSVRPQH
jgi:hypothetical protein